MKGLDLTYETADTYAGFDRLGRVVQQLWRDYGASADRDSYGYAYDRNSNRTYKDNDVSAGKQGTLTRFSLDGAFRCG